MTNAVTRYITVSTTCSIARDLGKVRGSSVSDKNPKNVACATWWSQPYWDWKHWEDSRLTIGKYNIGNRQKAFIEADLSHGVVLNRSLCFYADRDHGDDSRYKYTQKGLTKIDQHIDRKVGVVTNLHATDITYTFSIVRGRAPRKQMKSPMTPKTVVQVPWSVSVFIKIVNVSKWLDIRKIRSSSWPIPKISRPTRPIRISPASPMLWTCGCRSLNCPMTYPVYQDKPERNKIRMAALTNRWGGLLLRRVVGCLYSRCHS